MKLSLVLLILLTLLMSCTKEVQVSEDDFSIGMSVEHAVNKLREKEFNHVDVNENRIFASKKTSESWWGYKETRVILETKEEKITEVWIKIFNHGV